MVPVDPTNRPPSGIVPAVAGQDEPSSSAADDVFVGRAREMAELEAGLQDSLAGRGRLFLIGGEPGIGKSRLADELAKRAALQGARVVWGRCWEAGGAPAYWPWVQAIRSYVRGQPPEAIQSQLGRGASDVAQIILELHDLIPELPEPVSVDPDGARFRLFDSTMTFLRNAAEARPLVLILDDLHAADAPSLLLLGFIAGELVESHILVVGAYRREELLRDPQLAPILLEMDRRPATRHIQLSGLSESEVARFIEGNVDPPTSGGLATAVYRETDGNPLFVREVIQLMADEGQLGTTGPIRSRVAIPPRIREVIDRRLGLLSEPCRGVLTLASVLGQEFAVETLARVSDIPPDALLETIEEAFETRVVVEVPGTIGRMRFSHSLVRDALYEDLTTLQRTRLHREVGETLERLYAEDPGTHLAELSYHFCRAAPGGNADKAVDYARRAGERAAALLAYEEGVRLFNLALQVLEAGGSSDGGTRCLLLLALGDSQAREGDLAAARESFLAAASIARREHLPEQLAAAAIGYGGRFVWARAGGDPRLVPLLSEALDALPEGDTTIRARLMARMVGALRDERSPGEQDQLSRHAVEIARRVGDPATLSYALEGRFAATWWPDNARDRLTIATEMLQLASDAGDTERLAQATDWRICALMELGQIAAADVEIENLAKSVEELRQPAQRWLLLNSRGMRALFDGRFDEAERLIEEAKELGQRAQRWDAVHSNVLQTYLLRREQGRPQELESVLRRSIAEYPTRTVPRALLADLYRELGSRVEACRAFEDLAVDDFTRLRRDNDWLYTMSFLPDVCVYLGDADRADVLYELLSPYAGRHAITAGEVSAGSISRGLGILASMLRRWDEAADHFEEALAWNAANGARPWVAFTERDYARMLFTRDGPGDLERASELLASALETSRELGMVALERAIVAPIDTDTVAALSGNGVPRSPAPEGEAGIFRREGEYWTIRFEQDSVRLKDSKGLRFLAQLLASPGREFLALELAMAGSRSGSDGGRRDSDLRISSVRGEAVLDQQAMDAYRRRIEELQDELDEAERWADAGRVTRAREEMEALARGLADAVGLGGRSRRATSDAERARVNVTKTIKAAIVRIGEHSPALERHLAATIRTGTFCSYTPDPRLRDTWQI